jgi:hypothetical protein
MAKLGTGVAMDKLREDMARNLVGTKPSDFTLDCSANTATVTHVKCVATIKCATLDMFNANRILYKLRDYGEFFVANANILDRDASICWQGPVGKSFGETIVYSVDIQDTGSAAQLSVSVALLSGVLALFL